MQTDETNQQAFEQLQIQVASLTDLIRKSNISRNNVEKTIRTAEGVPMEEKTMLSDIDAIRESSIKVQHRATQELQKRMSIAGSEKAFPQSANVSVAGVPLSSEKKAQIKHWIPHIPSLTILKENEAQDLSERFPRSSLESPVTPYAETEERENDILHRSVSAPGFGYNPSKLSLRSTGRARSRSRENTLISSEEFERAMKKIIADSEARRTRPNKPFSDEDFNDISRLLRQVGKDAWSEIPRTYLVLRLIGEVHAIDDFILEQCKDIHFPYTEERLPGCLKGTGQRQCFLQKQALVLSPKNADLVQSGPHRHLDGSADVAFTIIRTLGGGGQGVVDQVRSKLSLQEYARKRIHRPRLFSKDKEALKMFENEINQMKKLEHEHLVRFVGSYTDRKYVGIVMEPVADTDLRRYLTRPFFPDEDLANLKSFMGCLASAVEYLHNQDCRHKDIKPANILIVQNKVLITDFGIARDCTDLSNDTTTGNPQRYTNAYVAPEVATAQARNKSSDIWSLGCVFLDILTVLRGSNLDQKKAYFESAGSGATVAWQNHAAVEGWIDLLGSDDNEHETPLRWTRHMTSMDARDRPDATSLREQILSAAGGGEVYCGICCGEDMVVSDDMSWKGSDADSENNEAELEAITSSYTLNTSISSSLSRPAALPVHKDLEISDTDSKSAVLFPPQAVNILKPRLPHLQSQTQTATYITALTSDAQEVAVPQTAQRDLPPIGVTTFEPRIQGPQPDILGLSNRHASSNLSNQVDDTVNETSLPGDDATDDSQTKVGSDTVTLLPSSEASISPRVDSVLFSHRLPLPFESHPDVVHTLFRADSTQLESHIVKLRDESNDITGLLLSAIKPFDRSKALWSMVHAAAYFERAELALSIVRAYINAGAKVDALNCASNIPLQYAAAKGHTEIVEYLIQSGSNAGHENIRKQTALHIAAHEKNDGVVSVLVQHLSVEAINARDDRGRTALHLACKSGDKLTAKILVEAGADTDVNNNDGETPLNCCNVDKMPEFFHFFREYRVASKIPPAESSLADEIKANGLYIRSAEREVGALIGPFNEGGPWGGINRCQCELCKVKLAMAPVLNADQEPILPCVCSAHVRVAAEQLLSGVEEVEETLRECPCKQCGQSRRKCGDAAESENLPSFCSCDGCQERDHRYIPELLSMDKYRGHEYYDKRIQKAIPRPCECSDCKTARRAAAVRLLAEFEFTGKKSYRLDPSKAWSWVISFVIRGVSRGNETSMPDVLRDVIGMLLASGANINATDNSGNTLLHVVAASGHLALASMLISNRAFLNAEDKEGDSPLANAVYFHRPEMVRLLLRGGAQIDKLNGGGKSTRQPVLHHVLNAYGEYGYMLPLILAHKPNVNMEDMKNIIPMQWAIFHRNPLPLRLLIEAGANMELATKGAPKPLFLALVIEAPDLVKVLLTYGANVHGKGTDPSALHVSAQVGAGKSILALLESPEAIKDLNTHDGARCTPLHLIADRQPTEEVLSATNAMIAAGANMSAEDSFGATPLHIAAKVGSLPMTKLLVLSGAVSEAQNHAGKTPCDLAASKRNKAVVEFLGGRLKKKRWYHRE